MLAAFMSMLDATIVNLALPAIQSEFKSAANELQWVLVVYVLTFAAGLLPFGRFGDVFGRRRIFLFGLSGFVVSSLGAGLSPSITVLIAVRAVRAVQGLAAAAMVPQVLALMHTPFLAKTRGRAIGYFGMVNALGAIAGPTIGGVLISADTMGLGWRLIFLVNLPVGLLAIAGTLVFLRKSKEQLSMKADWIGAGCFTIVVSCVVYPLIEGRSAGWPMWMIISPMVSVGFVFAFWQRQQRLEQLGRIQTLPLKLMGDRRYIISVGSVMVLISGLAGTMVVLAVYLQKGVGLSPVAAGFAIAPHPVSAIRSCHRRLEQSLLAGPEGQTATVMDNVIFVSRIV
nr:MFS transporter [uncultured Cohaesibacter sp.]